MSKKKNNGLKGLLLLLVIVLAALAIFLIEVTQDNMRVLITAYSSSDKKPLAAVDVSLDGKTKRTDDQGKVFFKLRVDENDKLLVKGEADGFKSVTDTIKIDVNRLNSKNISRYLVFEN